MAHGAVWVRRVRRVIATAALACLGVIGLNNLSAWRGVQTGGQRVAVLVALGPGVLALVAGVALWWRVSWLRSVLLALVIATAAAGGLASWARECADERRARSNGRRGGTGSGRRWSRVALTRAS